MRIIPWFAVRVLVTLRNPMTTALFTILSRRRSSAVSRHISSGNHPLGAVICGVESTPAKMENRRMKATIEIPDALLRRVKSAAADGESGLEPILRESQFQ